jgi:hypothetical protein
MKKDKEKKGRTRQIEQEETERNGRIDNRKKEKTNTAEE